MALEVNRRLSPRVLVLGGCVVLLGSWILLGLMGMGWGGQPASSAGRQHRRLEMLEEGGGSGQVAGHAERIAVSAGEAIAADGGPKQVSIRVIDAAGHEVVGARIVVTTSALHSGLSTPMGARELSATQVLFDRVTTSDAACELAVPRRARHFVRVEAPDGVRADGPSRIGVEGDDATELVYVVAPLYASAVLLSDGEIPLFVDWCLAARRPAWTGAMRGRREQLAERLMLEVWQVFLVAPKELPANRQCPISICHPKVGWFRAVADVVPADELRSPSVIVVPATGESKPVLVNVRCVKPSGDEVKVEVRLSGGSHPLGSHDGFPRFGRSFTSGTPQLFPPGRLEVGFVDGALNSMGLQYFDVDSDTTLTVNVPFTPRRLELFLEKDGVAFAGAVTAKVRVPALRKRYVSRWQNAPDGVFRISVPEEHACEVELDTSVGTALVEVARWSSGMSPEVRVPLR